MFFTYRGWTRFNLNNLGKTTPYTIIMYVVLFIVFLSVFMYIFNVYNYTLSYYNSPEKATPATFNLFLILFYNKKIYF